MDQDATRGTHAPRDGTGRFPSDGAEPRSHGRSGCDLGCAPRRLRAGGGGARHLRRYGRAELFETRADGRALWHRRQRIMLADEGFLDLGPKMRLEYRMIGPRPDAAPTIVMLHEGLGCVGLWGNFPEKLAAATGA